MEQADLDMIFKQFIEEQLVCLDQQHYRLNLRPISV